jgi:hypothetical protein
MANVLAAENSGGVMRRGAPKSLHGTADASARRHESSPEHLRRRSKSLSNKSSSSKEQRNPSPTSVIPSHNEMEYHHRQQHKPQSVTSHRRRSKSNPPDTPPSLQPSPATRRRNAMKLHAKLTKDSQRVASSYAPSSSHGTVAAGTTTTRASAGTKQSSVAMTVHDGASQSRSLLSHQLRRRSSTSCDPSPAPRYQHQHHAPRATNHLQQQQQQLPQYPAYQIGQRAHIQDILKFTSKQSAQSQLTSLPSGTPVFVKRTNRQWTYAILVGHRYGQHASGKEDSIVVTLDVDKSMRKFIGRGKWHSCVCLVRKMDDGQAGGLMQSAAPKSNSFSRANSAPNRICQSSNASRKEPRPQPRQQQQRRTSEQIMMFPPNSSTSATDDSLRRIVSLNDIDNKLSSDTANAAESTLTGTSISPLRRTGSSPNSPTSIAINLNVPVNLNAKTFCGSRRDRMRPMQRSASTGVMHYQRTQLFGSSCPSLLDSSSSSAEPQQDGGCDGDSIVTTAKLSIQKMRLRGLDP